MKMTPILKLEEYIDKYRVVSFANIRSRFPNLSYDDIVFATNHLYSNRKIWYSFPKDRNPTKILYFSRTFNMKKKLTIYDNSYMAILKCLTVLDGFRKHYNVISERIDRFPVVVDFKVMFEDKTSIKRIQLIYLEYSEKNQNAKYIASLLQQRDDGKANINRYIVLESYGVLNANSPQDICDYIPNVRGFALTTKNLLSTEFFSLESLGVREND